MEDLAKRAVEYINTIIKTNSECTPWVKSKFVPFHLTHDYDFCETNIIGTPCLLMIAKEPQHIRSDTLLKYFAIIRAYYSGPIIYVQYAITRFNRKKFIENKIPFIIPGNQMYLPDIGIDFPTHFRQIKEKPV